VVDEYRLFGFICDGGENNGVTGWRGDGRYYWDGREADYDIIGMYPKTRIINGFEVPAPETEEPKKDDWFFKAGIYSEEFYDEESWRGCSYDLRLLKRGLLFLTKEDAIANAKAMLGINPCEESE
jgi:hypothetical protein